MTIIHQGSNPSIKILTKVGNPYKSSSAKNSGLEECDYQPHLDRLILDIVGLDEESDEVVQFYNSVMEKRCKKINEDRESIVKQALKAYNELLGEKKRRSVPN